MLIDVDQPKKATEIIRIASRVGLPEARRWNVSALLGAARGRAIRVPDGWLLTSKARKETEQLFCINPHAVVGVDQISALRKHLADISKPETKAFVQEAISCFEAKLLRAAVILSWVGAVSLLYDFVVEKRLDDFNAEARRRDARWKDAKTSDGLSRMKESTFLDVIETIGIIGKNVKLELQNSCLALRNGCGHPNNFRVGEHRVASHLETLIQNVFSRFG